FPPASDPTATRQRACEQNSPKHSSSPSRLHRQAHAPSSTTPSSEDSNCASTPTAHASTTPTIATPQDKNADPSSHATENSPSTKHARVPHASARTPETAPIPP